MENGTHHCQIAQKNNSHLQDGNWEGLAEMNMNQVKKELLLLFFVKLSTEKISRDFKAKRG